MIFIFTLFIIGITNFFASLGLASFIIHAATASVILQVIYLLIFENSKEALDELDKESKKR